MSKSTKIFWIAPAFATIAALSSCSLMKNMDDMHVNTGEMNDKLSVTNDKMSKMEERLASLDAMNKAMEDMLAKLGFMVNDMSDLGKIMVEMNQNMKNLYGDNRQGTSLQARDSDFFDLLNKKTTQQEAKLVVAGEYFMAYEDQLWKNSGNDDQAALTELRHEAVQQFLHDLAQFIPAGKNKDTSPSNTDNNSMNTYALAFAMDLINPHYAKIAKDNKLTAVSMLDLIETGISDGSLDSSLNPGTDENTADFEIQSNMDVALYLLQVRANFLPAVVLSKLSDINEPGFTGTWAKLKDFLGHWNMNYGDKSTPATIRFLTETMKKANAERAFLSTVKIKNFHGDVMKTAVTMDKNLMRVIGHMEMPASLYPLHPSPNASKHEMEEYWASVKLLDDLVREIQIFRGDKNPIPVASN
ncbi:MAG: hypothetical protein ACXWPM_00880 [Bdellovibrionota bacterium]